MRRTLQDPDLGRIQLPPPPTRAVFEKRATRALRATKGRRHWPKGSVSSCPGCGRRTFVGRDDLEEVIPRPGGVVVFRRLRGGRCDVCRAQVLEPEDLIRVEGEATTASASDYEAKVCRIGTGTLGTYWPKDVVRNMELTPLKRAFIHVLDRNLALIRFCPRVDAKGHGLEMSRGWGRRPARGRPKPKRPGIARPHARRRRG